jgi:hypothetical protein
MPSYHKGHTSWHPLAQNQLLTTLVCSGLQHRDTWFHTCCGFWVKLSLCRGGRGQRGTMPRVQIGSGWAPCSASPANSWAGGPARQQLLQKTRDPWRPGSPGAILQRWDNAVCSAFLGISESHLKARNRSQIQVLLGNNTTGAMSSYKTIGGRTVVQGQPSPGGTASSYLKNNKSKEQLGAWLKW